MGNAFTPGLLVADNVRVKKIRHLPVGGNAIVKVGDSVSATDSVAQAERQGNLVIVRASEELELDPQRVTHFLHVKKGDTVAAGTVIGSVEHLFGLIRNECKTPVAGIIEEISDKTGHISVRQPPHQITVPAYINGKVVEVTKSYIAIETQASIVQGIFGLGGERYAPLEVVNTNGDITAECIHAGCADKVVIGTGAITSGGVAKAIECKVKGIVAGSIAHEVLDEILGEPIGVAITGQEDIPFTLVITEGFGSIPMADATRKLFVSMNGEYVALNGTTQIRAGVVRPEVICSREGRGDHAEETELAVAKELKAGTRIRIIRAPYFGRLATVTGLPEQPMKVETGAAVRVLNANCDNGENITVPRANVEIVA